MTLAVTQFASESSSGIGALGIDGKAFVIQLVTFGLAFFVLQRYAFKPILKVMDQRRKTIEDGVTIGESMKKQQAELDKKVADELAKARSLADGVIADAQAAARQVASDAEAKTQKKTETMLSEAKLRIEQEEARSRKRIMGDVVDLISDATETIIDEKVDAKKDAALIDKALKGRA